MIGFRSTLALFLLPALLVAALAALFNLGTLQGFKERQDQSIAAASEKFAMVATGARLVVDLGKLHGRVHDMLDLAAAGKIDEAAGYRIHATTVDELAALEQRMRDFSQGVRRVEGSGKLLDEIDADFAIYRNFAMMASDIAAIDPTTASRHADEAQHRFFSFASNTHALTLSLSELAQGHMVNTRIESERAFRLFAGIGMASVLLMLALSYWSARRLSGHLGTLIIAIRQLAHNSEHPPALREIEALRDSHGGELRNMAEAVLRFRDALVERRQAQADLHQSHHRLAEAERIAHLGTWELDLRNDRLHWSDEIFRIFEIDAERFGASYAAFLDLIHPDDREAVKTAYARSLAERQPYSIEHRLRFADGRVKFVQEQAETLYADDGSPLRSIGTIQDITARKQAEAEIHRLANFDPLTNLPNRTLLSDRIGQALFSSRNQRSHDALILCNLDRFKTLNDARGHVIGDELLTAVAARLATFLREGDTLARLAGDEFAILQPDLGPTAEIAARRAMQMAGKVSDGLRQSFLVAGEELRLTASLGVALFPESANDSPGDILRRADTALHRAKEAGGSQVAFFDTDMGENALQRFQVERELRHAIPAGQLRLYLQAQVHGDGTLAGAEALVRWQHPARGIVPPAAFIPVAEETDLIVDLDAWVMAEVCRVLAEADRAGQALRISVNVSPRHFRQPGFVTWVSRLLASSGADPARLTLEVTEGLVIENIGEVIAKMTELSRLGIHFSIDDFGTGYSSLAYLKRLPIHELKIDKTFIQDIPGDENNAALVEAILAIARHLKLHVVAEGVETAEQASFLDSRSRVIHQGYLFSRPEPAADWLARWMAR